MSTTQTGEHQTPSRPMYKGQSYWTDITQEDEPAVDAKQEQEPGDANAAIPDPAPATPEENVYKQRYDALKAHYDRQVNAFREREKSLKDELKQSTEKLNLPTSQEELEQWRQEFPDLYRVVRMIARLEADDKAKALETQLEQVAVERRQSAREKAEAQLLRLHPDFDDLRKDQKFIDWLNVQPPMIQAGLYDNTDDPYLAARVIDLYKHEAGIRKPTVKDKKQQELDASLAVGKPGKGDVEPNTKQKTWKLSEIDRMGATEYTKYEAEIDKAFAEGRVIFDK